MNCDCGAQPGDTDHEPNCHRLQGDTDDQSDHYGQ